MACASGRLYAIVTASVAASVRAPIVSQDRCDAYVLRRHNLKRRLDSKRPSRLGDRPGVGTSCRLSRVALLRASSRRLAALIRRPRAPWASMCESSRSRVTDGPQSTICEILLYIPKVLVFLAKVRSSSSHTWPAPWREWSFRTLCSRAGPRRRRSLHGDGGFRHPIRRISNHIKWACLPSLWRLAW